MDGCYFYGVTTEDEFELLNTSVLWTLVQCGLDRIDTLIFANGENATNPSCHVSLTIASEWMCFSFSGGAGGV